MLTEQEYLDPQRFPLTTQPGLSLRSQHLIDAVNHDQLVEAQQQGVEINPGQLRKLAELREKLANVPLQAKPAAR